MEVCLPTLKRIKSNKYSLTIIIIDNGSNIKEREKLNTILSHYRHIKLIETNNNLGFAKGNNVGIRYSLKKGADFIVLLNNDTKVEGNFIKRAIELDTDILSPVVTFREFKDNPKQIYDLGGIVNWWTGRTTHKNAYKNEYLKLKNSQPFEVDYVAGCAMMVKREVFEKIGFLDERYFIYFEDVDFCITAKKAGFKVIVDPQTTIYHKLGGSMDRWSGRAIYHNLLSNYLFIGKHLGLRKISGYFYLLILTLKILRDYFRDFLKGKNFLMNKKKWRGAKPFQ